MNTKLKELLFITEFTNLFANVLRKTVLNKNGTAENNAQHSFQVAIIAWYICDKENLDLNIEKIIKYALVHDLMEAYSGTFPAYERDSLAQSSKDQVEEQAINKIEKEFKKFKTLIVSLREYLKQEDRESKFIYALDKLLPIINIELNNHDFYFQTHTTYEDMIIAKDQKISQDPVVYEYFKLLRTYLKEDAKFFWPENKERDYSIKEYTKKLIYKNI